MHKKWMLYGANGYTGRLIAEEARDRGMMPVLAGRNDAAVEAVATEHGFDYRVFDLNNKQATEQALDGISVVLHCAGPFSGTSQPMIEACLKQACHYLDITGEISVFANAHAQSELARRANIVLLPGVGFDVVPTDCLASVLASKLPEAVELALAFESGGSMSPGTAKTSIEGLAGGGSVRRGRQVTSVPLAWKTREIPFLHATRSAMTIPWGDVFTAYISTGIPDIEVYMATPPATIRNLRRMRFIKPLLTLGWVQTWLKTRMGKSVKGPGKKARENSQMQLWGEVRCADGRCVSATMTTPDGYDVTVSASLGIVKYVLANEVEGGFYTPSLLLGPDYATTLPGVSLQLN